MTGVIDRSENHDAAALKVQSLSVSFPVERHRRLVAVEDVSFEIANGESSASSASRVAARRRSPGASSDSSVRIPGSSPSTASMSTNAAVVRSAARCS